MKRIFVATILWGLAWAALAQVGPLPGVGPLPIYAPVSTCIAGNDANTVMMLHFDGTNGSTTIVDSSTGGVNSPHSMSVGGTLSLSTSIKKFGTAAASASGGYTFPSVSGDFQFSGDWTVDTWIYPVGSWPATWGLMNNFNGSVGWQFYGNSTPAVILYGNGGLGSVGFSAAFNTWTWLAIVHSGTTNTLYINGTSVGTFTSGGTFSSGGQFYISGGNGNLFQFPGYLDEMRISKVARVIPSTPPSAPYC